MKSIFFRAIRRIRNNGSVENGGENCFRPENAASTIMLFSETLAIILSIAQGSQ